MLNYPYDVIIAQAVNNELIILDSTTWDTEKDAIEYFRYSMMGDDGVLYEHIVPIYEFYFDTAHLVTDTFYVGFHLKVPYDDQATIGMRFLLNCSVDSVSTIWVLNDDLQLTRGQHNYVWGGEFPILQPNRRCHTPTSAPQIIIYNATNTVRFTLPYETGDSLLLSIARAGQPADSGDIYPVTAVTMDIVVPDSGRYTARLARVCRRDIDVQSRWGASQDFVIFTPLGIAPMVSGSAPGLLLYPNPASKTVTIACDETDGTLEVVDIQGRTMLHVHATQRTIDISGLVAGCYIVRLTNAKGTSIGRLQVE